MLQKLLTAIIAEEWAHLYDSHPESSKIPLSHESTLAQEITDKTLSWLQGKPPAAYHEMAFALSRLHADCTSLLQLFSTDCKLPMSSIPSLGAEIDLSGTIKGHFSIEVAQQAMGAMYTKLKDSLGRTRKKELALIAEKRNTILASIQRYNEIKFQHDIRVSSSFAAAFVAFKNTPDKVSPVVKGIMNGIKVNTYHSTLCLLTRAVERRERRPTKSCCRCCRFLRRLLCRTQTLAASGQNSEKSLHLPLSRCGPDSNLCLFAYIDGRHPLIPSGRWVETESN
jgi:hypothetical protein